MGDRASDPAHPTIGVLGAGYVGCITAACLADRGHRVIALDTDASKVALISAGSSPVLEPGLGELIASQVTAGRLTAGVPSPQVLASLDVAIICVSTPSMPDGSVDVRPMRRALGTLADAVQGRSVPTLVIVRSTVAPNLLRDAWAEIPQASRSHLRLVVNPELLRETTAIADFESPPFQLYGADDLDDARSASEVFAPLAAPIHLVDIETAMLVKYASNAFHALKIAFANEIGALADMFGADAKQVMSIFCEDRSLNVSSAYLRPGFAFGGSCLPKDVRGLVSLGRTSNLRLPVLEGVLRSNDDRIVATAQEIAALRVERVAVLGLSFKHGTDDIRESPYVLLARELATRGMLVRAFDPDVDLSKLVGGNLDYLTRTLDEPATMLRPTMKDALADAEAVVVCKWVAAPDRVLDAIKGIPHVFDIERSFDSAYPRSL